MKIKIFFGRTGRRKCGPERGFPGAFILRTMSFPSPRSLMRRPDASAGAGLGWNSAKIP